MIDGWIDAGRNKEMTVSLLDPTDIQRELDDRQMTDT